MKIAVAVSGRGTTLSDLIEAQQDGTLKERISLVVASKACPAVEIATKANIPVVITEDLLGACEGFDLICLAGWMPILKVPDSWHRRIMNMHPSMLPKYGGLGMYGRRVHEAVIKAGEKKTGTTVHYVTNEVDNGPIISSYPCDVMRNDTPESLAERVRYLQKDQYPDAINRHLVSHYTFTDSELYAAHEQMKARQKKYDESVKRASVWLTEKVGHQSRFAPLPREQLYSPYVTPALLWFECTGEERNPVRNSLLQLGAKPHNKILDEEPRYEITTPYGDFQVAINEAKPLGVFPTGIFNAGEGDTLTIV